METARQDYQEVPFRSHKDAIFYVSHSGGKDSQAMYNYIMERVPVDQVVVVHADLGEVEWKGALQHVEETTVHPVNVVTAVYQDGSPKTLLNYVEYRLSKRPDAPPWPSSKARWCTSELKTGPIKKFIRADMKARGAKYGVNCTGIRAEESVSRSKKSPLKLNEELSKAGRVVFDYMPIYHWTTEEVFKYIHAKGQEPFWIYKDLPTPNSRMSCVFCIFGDAVDLSNGKLQRPELYRKYTDLEETSGYSLFHKKSLAEKIATIEI